MVIVEFLLIAVVVGVLTETWLGFLGTFFGLYALYRFTRLSAVLAFALSAYWGLLGYHLGTATGELGVGPLLAVVGFVAGAGVHRGGFAQLLARRTPTVLQRRSPSLTRMGRRGRRPLQRRTPMRRRR